MTDLPHYWGPAPNIGHPGLLLEKYLDWRVVNGQIQAFSQELDQAPHLRSVVKANEKLRRSGDAILKERYEFLKSLRAHGEVCTRDVTPIWNVLSDLSRTGLVENGSITLHPVYGFFYLKGQSLKGLASNWCKREPGKDAPFARIFGGDEHGQGTVEFLDAWPTAWPELRVMDSAVHFADYYKGAGPPHDSSAPDTHCFLAAGPTKFVLALKAAPHACAGDVETAMDWLVNALSDDGYGAKTGSAFGYME